MYAYIKGVLADVEEESVVVEAGGIGYRIYTTGRRLTIFRLWERKSSSIRI